MPESTYGTSTRTIIRLTEIPPIEHIPDSNPPTVKNDWLEFDPLFVALSLSSLVTSFLGSMFLNGRAFLSGPKWRDDRKINRYPWEKIHGDCRQRTEGIVRRSIGPLSDSSGNNPNDSNINPKSPPDKRRYISSQMQVCNPIFLIMIYIYISNYDGRIDPKFEDIMDIFRQYQIYY